MIEYKDLEDFRRRSFRAVASVYENDTIERIVPIAFPVYQSTWSVKLRIEKTTGLVDRQLLTAVQKLGPISAAEVADWMGLSPDIIESSLRELVKAGVELHCDEGLWSLSQTAEIRHFYVEQVHDYAFVTNAITGNFLPLSQTRSLKSIVLSSEEVKKFCLQPMIHVASSSEGSLVKSIRTSKRAHDFAGYGIPDGFVCFAEKTPKTEYAAFVLAYLYILKDGRVEIVSATESAFRFDCPEQIAERYVKSWMRETVREDFEGIEYEDEGNQRFIRVRDVNLWGSDLRPGDPAGRSVRLLRLMIYPSWTCDADGAFHRLLPGDPDTAYRLMLYRGCSLLRRSYSQIKSVEDMSEIVAEFSEECEREFPGLKKRPDFDEVLKLAAESKDGDLVELARRFLPQMPTVVKTTKPKISFVRSCGRRFFDLIVKAIDSARVSIVIISPVLDEEGVFQALERAQKRGVRDIYVITRLSEHKNNIFKTDPQFRDYELPRRRLAALGVNVRDCEHTVHAKMIVVDSCWFFFASANLNANSLGVGGVCAVESGIVYEDSFVAKVGERMFWEVWGSASFRQVRNDERITIASVPQQREIRMLPIQKRRGYSFFLSTPENQLLMRKMCALISQAKKEIRISTMSFYDLEAVPELFAELKNALGRGVKVKVCVRPGAEMNFSPDRWPDPSTEKLRKAGLALYQCRHLHAKGMIVDGSLALMTSANFNPFSLGNSRTAHIEMAVVGATTLKPMSEFAAFVSGLFKSVSEVSC